MQGLTHRWIEPKPTPPGPPLGIAGRVLAARGLRGEEASRFCAPSLTEMHNPSRMPGLERAADRLLQAIEGGERVVIYGDYDVDGVSATAILWHTIRAIDPDATTSGRVRTYIPHRLDEGYGLNADALRRFADEGTRVVVSVDCGITAREEARVARDAGLDLIITDHHTPPADACDLPDAFALVHPRIAEGYPFGELCGAGVAFKLAWRLATLENGSDRVKPAMRRVLLDNLALAGLATIADVVPLVGENRVIAKQGLARVKHTDLIGLSALVEASGLDGQDVGSEEAGFVLGPRLNACGRMGHAAEAVELLTTDDHTRAQELANALDRHNRSRREMERRIFEEACVRAEGEGMTRDDSRAIVLAGEAWHPGVVGIVCSRLVGKYHRPAVLLCDDGDVASGSGRSIGGYNLHAGLVHCASMLTRFGGHDMAAGMSLPSEDVLAFAEKLRAHARQEIPSESLTPELKPDCTAHIGELNLEEARSLCQLAPFGRSNREPRLLVRGLRCAQAAQTMGSTGAHLQVRLSSPAGHGDLRAIAWRWGEHAPLLHAGAEFDAVLTLRTNTWRGIERVEVELLDVSLQAYA